MFNQNMNNGNFMGFFFICRPNVDSMETCWSLSSEERSVKHFHFTVWPDRGVPQGTEVLIQFRRIVRQDIESDGSESPTVVHCSDGVGRTGTFIALDFLLQQLEKQQAVGIKDFLHRMRRHRSHMVQTEVKLLYAASG
uniref:protein-tyrosine-phosphatase n=1 Tax=Xiphophorus couchianus TaxID=32473 RepID=A0A3B5KRA1_9TELE